MIETTPAQKQIGVFEPRTPSRCRPDYFVDLNEARQRVKNGEAHFVNNNKSIRILALPSPQLERQYHQIRGVSASPGGTAKSPGGLTERYALAMSSFIDSKRPGNDAVAIAIVNGSREIGIRIPNKTPRGAQ